VREDDDRQCCECFPSFDLSKILNSRYQLVSLLLKAFSNLLKFAATMVALTKYVFLKSRQELNARPTGLRGVFPQILARWVLFSAYIQRFALCKFFCNLTELAAKS